MKTPPASSSPRVTLRSFALAAVVAALALTLFVVSAATQSHRRQCERVCHAKGERYDRAFAWVPLYKPPCGCVARR